MAIVRLTVNNQMEEAFDFLEKRFGFLSRAEILKISLAEFYKKNKEEQIEQLNEEVVDEIEEALKDYEKGKVVTLSSANEVDECFDRLDNE